MVTAKNRAIDLIRSDEVRTRHLARLRIEDERIVLILRFLSGLTTAEVAVGFLIETATMQQRIVRAKQRILKTGMPFGRPAPAELGDRLPGVLRVLYLIFTQGINATAGPAHTRVDLQHEAIRLARLLV